MNVTESLLRAIFAVSVWRAFSPSEVARIVGPQKRSDKQASAYNLCDGKTSQRDIAKRTKLDQRLFSRTLSRWIEAGVVVRVGRISFRSTCFR
jgi:hypothetical protein